MALLGWLVCVAMVVALVLAVMQGSGMRALAAVHHYLFIDQSLQLAPPPSSPPQISPLKTSGSK